MIYVDVGTLDAAEAGIHLTTLIAGFLRAVAHL